MSSFFEPLHYLEAYRGVVAHLGVGALARTGAEDKLVVLRGVIVSPVKPVRVAGGQVALDRTAACEKRCAVDGDLQLAHL